jgi:hypothetical protein
MVAMMNNTSVPPAIAVTMPIIPARKVIMPTRWATADVNRPPMGAPRTRGHMGGEHQSEDERAAGVELIFDQRRHERLVEGSGRPSGQEHRCRNREQMPDPGRYTDPG